MIFVHRYFQETAFLAALRIHVSKETKSILDELGGYQLVERGEVEMKVKGKNYPFYNSC